MGRMQGSETAPLSDRDRVARRQGTQDRREGRFAPAVLGIDQREGREGYIPPSATESNDPMFLSSRSLLIIPASMQRKGAPGQYQMGLNYWGRGPRQSRIHGPGSPHRGHFTTTLDTAP